MCLCEVGNTWAVDQQAFSEVLMCVLLFCYFLATTQQRIRLDLSRDRNKLVYERS